MTYNKLKKRQKIFIKRDGHRQPQEGKINEKITYGTFKPNDVEKDNVGKNLTTIIFQHCHQGGKNEKKWEDAFGNKIDVVGWSETMTVSETKRFNSWGWFDRQDKNLRDYLKEAVKRKSNGDTVSKRDAATESETTKGKKNK